MITFRDKSFCSSDCTNKACDRYFGEAQQRQADAWWGKPGAPVAFMDLSKGCEDYMPRRQPEPRFFIDPNTDDLYIRPRIPLIQKRKSHE